MKAHASVWFVTVFVSVLLVGLLIYTVKEGSDMTAYTTLDIKEVKTCYDVNDDKLTPNPDIAECCILLSNSEGCQKYESKELADDLYKCKSDRIIVANKALINFCMGK